MEEIWKDIPNTNGIYQASNLGQIRSVYHVDHRGRPWPGKVLKQCRNGNNGYVGVTIFKKPKKSHRLICSAFFGNRDSSVHVNHKNGIRSDNRLDNFEWCTPQENVKHSFKVLNKKSSGGHKGKTGLLNHNSKKVLATNIKNNKQFIFGSTAEAARILNIASGSIPRVCNKKQSNSKGWNFVYI
jgi:hypothetical protein